jgi:cytoskeletal protein RodZ
LKPTPIDIPKNPGNIHRRRKEMRLFIIYHLIILVIILGALGAFLLIYRGMISITTTADGKTAHKFIGEEQIVKNDDGDGVFILKLQWRP